MKNLFRQFLYAAAALGILGSSGCNNDDPEPEYEKPQIAIGEVTATASSVTFTLTPTNALRYTYAVAPKGTTATPVEVAATAPVTRTVEGLEADRDYTITAIAYGEGGLQSEPVTYDFVTNALAQIAIGQVTATHKSASFTLTPTNATGYAYRYAPTDAAATDTAGEWVHVEGGKPSDVTLTGLDAVTTYVIEAYATNAEGDGEIVTKTFTTETLPEPLTVSAAATSQVVWMKFAMCEDVTAGYYYYLHDSSYTDDPVYSLETFLQDLRENPSWYTLMTSSEEMLQTNCMPNTSFRLFTVSTDLEGDIAEDTAAEMTVTTKQLDALRTSRSMVEIESFTPGYISVEAELNPSDDCVLVLVDCVKRTDAARVGSITAYVNMNLGNFTPVLRSSLGDSYLLRELVPETDYFLFTVGIDGNGDYGLLDSREFKTTAVDYRQDVAVGVEVTERGFHDVSLNVTYDNCTSVRHLYLTDKQLIDWYNGSEDEVWQKLFSATADVLLEGEVKIENLEYDSTYTLFALPVTADGAFGMPLKTQFATLKYTANGTAELTVTPEGIDRTSNFPVAKFTLTPGTGCEKFIYYAVDEESYANNSARIGEYLFRLGYYQTVDPAVETEVEVTLWASDYYLLTAACDAQGNWSRVQVSEKLIYNPNGGDGDGDLEPEGDPDEVPTDQISATAVTVTFRSYLYDQSSWNPDWGDWDNSVYRADITLEAGYTAWYYFVDSNSYNWVMGNDVGEGKPYATMALWIKDFGQQITESGPIAARGEYGSDYIMLVLPETTDGKHASARIYQSQTYSWYDLTGETTDPGITGNDNGGSDIDPRARKR